MRIAHLLLCASAVVAEGPYIPSVVPAEAIEQVRSNAEQTLVVTTTIHAKGRSSRLTNKKKKKSQRKPSRSEKRTTDAQPPPIFVPQPHAANAPVHLPKMIAEPTIIEPFVPLPLPASAPLAMNLRHFPAPLADAPRTKQWQSNIQQRRSYIPAASWARRY